MNHSEFSTDLPRADIAQKKREAARLYNQFHEALGNYDCGVAMAKHINPNLAKVAEKYNETMTELRRLDPKCPEFKPL